MPDEVASASERDLPVPVKLPVPVNVPVPVNEPVKFKLPVTELNFKLKNDFDNMMMINLKDDHLQSLSHKSLAAAFTRAYQPGQCHGKYRDSGCSPAC